MSKRSINAEGLAAVGPYSHAVTTGELVFLSGQTPLDPTTGELIIGGVTEQTRQCFRNIFTVLAAAELTFADIVKTTVFLTDMEDFAEMNSEYATHFDGLLPARSTVAVAGLPLGARVEIECIACR